MCFLMMFYASIFSSVADIVCNKSFFTQIKLHIPQEKVDKSPLDLYNICINSDYFLHERRDRI